MKWYGNYANNLLIEVRPTDSTKVDPAHGYTVTRVSYNLIRCLRATLELPAWRWWDSDNAPALWAKRHFSHSSGISYFPRPMRSSAWFDILLKH